LDAIAAGELPGGAIRGDARLDERAPIAFLFTGQGSQAAGMGRALYETQPTFRQALARCDAALGGALARPLLAALYPATAAGAGGRGAGGAGAGEGAASGRGGAGAGGQAALEGAGVRTQALRVAQAFHSAQLEPMLDAFTAVAETVTYAAPAVGFISTVTGRR